MTQALPKVSVGLPVYNGERYVAQAIESMLAQTFCDFELIISDNGSTDRTAAICQDYAQRDNRIRFHREETNRGLVWNWNRAASLARGKYFKWISHDDTYAPEYLERCLGLLENEPEVAWCHCQTTMIDEQGVSIPASVRAASPSDAARDRNQAATTVTLSQSHQPHERFGAALMRSLLSDVMAVFRTDMLRQTGFHPPYYGGDKVLIAEVSLLGRYHEFPEGMARIRRHAGQSQWVRNRRELHEIFTGKPAGWIVVPRQVRCTLAYFGLACKARLPWRERFRCVKEVFRFIFQTHKWKRLVVDALRSVGIRIPVPEDQVDPTHRHGTQAASVEP